MKKALLILTLAFFGLGSVSAQGHTFGQIGVGFGSQSYQLSSTNVETVNIGLSGSSFWGEDLGLLWTYGMGLIQSVNYNGSSQALSHYDMHLAFDFVVGPGYRWVINEKFSSVLGAGVHLGETMLAATYGSGSSSFLVLAYGVGASGSVQYMFNENFGLTGGLNLGYDFGTGLLDAASETFKSGLSVTPYVGLAFKS